MNKEKLTIELMYIYSTKEDDWEALYVNGTLIGKPYCEYSSNLIEHLNSLISEKGPIYSISKDILFADEDDWDKLPNYVNFDPDEEDENWIFFSDWAYGSEED